MTKASDNEFPSVLFEEGAAPSPPDSGDRRVFFDVADHLFKSIDATGTIRTIGSGSALSVTDGITTVDATTLTAAPGAVSDLGSGNAGLLPYIGTTPDAPLALAPADYLLSSTVETIPNHTYDDGTGGVGATVTEWSTGSVLTSDLSSGGADYALGDTFTIDGGDGTAAGEVDTVDGGGAVLTYHLTSGGDGYAVGSGYSTTATTGIGTGFTLDILTLTVTATGPALTADSSNPTVGQRIVFYDGGGEETGIYVVTEPGDGVSVPWVLTRASDNDTPVKRCVYWGVGILSGDRFAQGTARVTWTDGTSGLGLALASLFSTAFGYSTASGQASMALGSSSIASGNQSFALNGGQASGVGSVALSGVASGPGSFAMTGGTSTGHGSVSLGSDALADWSAVFGYNGRTYQWGQAAFASGGSVFNEYSFWSAGVSTVDDTPTPIMDSALSNYTFPDFTRTSLIEVKVVARRVDTPGTDSVWESAACMSGDGSSAYRWIGGADPGVAVVAQDAAASAWVVAVTIDGASIVVTVTGEIGSTIDWMTTIKIYEVI